MRRSTPASYFSILTALTLGLSFSVSVAQESKPQAPFKYVSGKAYHILPETHSDESGYFSIVEGLDGKVYVGTAKYNINSFLVEFDPKTETQKIVIDTNKVTGATGTGFGAQSKIHTRNFVGPSGKVYLGSMQGHSAKNDPTPYPGGYVMIYDPKTQKAESLGIAAPGKGVIDVVADEARGLIYVATFDDAGENDWLLYDMKTRQYRKLGPMLVPFASTLLGPNGLAYTLTRDYQLATYNPDSNMLSLRDVMAGKEKWSGARSGGPPTWRISANGTRAYLVMMSDPTLWELNLGTKGKTIIAKSYGKMLEGSGFDSRSSMSIAPDGRVYVLFKAKNNTGFGSGALHHLLRFDPKTKKSQDLGVLTVKNPDFFNFGPRADGTKPPWSHGFHTLPDGTLTPLHVHQGLIVARDGTLYALILYPYTLLRLEGVS